MTATATFSKKYLYHSDLAKHGEIIVQFTGEPRDSQYPNKPRWCGLMVQGDDTKYTLNIENADVEATIAKAPKNAWISVRAEGRGDQAFMLLEDGNGGPILPGDKPPAQVQRPARASQDAPPPNEWDGEEIGVVLSGTTSASVGLAVAMTIGAVQGLEKAGIRVDSDAAARIYSTHFIQTSRG